MDLRHRFAKNLREARTARGLSQEDLAELAGLHRTYISDLEREHRNPTLDVLGRLARALEMEASVLLEARKK